VVLKCKKIQISILPCENFNFVTKISRYFAKYEINISGNFATATNLGGGGALRVSSETSFVPYFAKHETKQVSCFAKQTCRFAKFRFEAKLAVSHVSLFLNETKPSVSPVS
jgi:hypothetical protein